MFYIVKLYVLFPFLLFLYQILLFVAGADRKGGPGWCEMAAKLTSSFP